MACQSILNKLNIRQSLSKSLLLVILVWEISSNISVLLVFSLLILLIVNYGADLFKYENFVDPPYSCNANAGDRNACIQAGGYWAEDGQLPTGCDSACKCCVPNASFPTSMRYPAPVCPSSSASFTLTETTTMYTNTMLPTQSSARGADGTLTADSLKTHVDNLIKASRLIAAPATSADPQTIHTYLQADEKAITDMQAEYCYYSNRYTYAITQMLQSATASGSAPNQGADWLAAARTLNVRLTDLITLMKYLTTTRLAYGADASAMQLNADLTVRMKSLSDQSNDLVGPNANTTVYKKMVEYTKQKGKANGNLVLLYTFMNLIALGMLFYVYTAT